MVLAAQLVAGAGAASADTLPGPPYIDHTSWARYGGQVSLRVFPTKAGRVVAGDIGKTAAQTDEAWQEVLVLAPGANSPECVPTSSAIGTSPNSPSRERPAGIWNHGGRWWTTTP